MSRARLTSRSESALGSEAVRRIGSSSVERLSREATYTKSSRNLAAMSLATYLQARRCASKRVGAKGVGGER